MRRCRRPTVPETRSASAPARTAPGLSVIPGATSSSVVMSNVTVLAAGTYTVIVTGACNAATNSATLTVNEPTTATPLADQTQCFGGSATFSTTAGGTGPLSYIW